mmetsp:Transcript_7246/g.16452  ORF Transcript_7246/g.16452 Transcript_7246/m.16452 type:complete len:231 (+) Transcript_7246:1460-2152(+)
MALAGMGGMERPGGGRAGEAWVVALAGGAVVVAGGGRTGASKMASVSAPNEPNPKSKSSSPSPVSQCPILSTLLGLTSTAAGAKGADTVGGVATADAMGLGSETSSGSGMEGTAEIAPTGEGCEMSTGVCCCCCDVDSVASRMGSHPEALMLAPFTEGGRTLSSDTPNELCSTKVCSSSVVSGSGNNGSSSMGNEVVSSGTSSESDSDSTTSESRGNGEGGAAGTGFFNR